MNGKIVVMPTLGTQIGVTIRDIGIPPRPSILAEIDQEMAKDSPDFSHLAKILSADVALSAGLLKTTNSPFFGLEKKVRSVPEAILVLGLNMVTRTVAVLSLHKAFEHIPGMERFWDASATTARLCGWLAKRLRRRCAIRSEDAYTFGLFHDCGIPMMMNPFPEYRDILIQANQEQTRLFTDIENEVFSTNHAEIGAELAASWLLPKEIVEAIRHHHDLPALADGQLDSSTHVILPLIAIVQLAEHLLSQRTGMSKSYEWQKVGDTALNILGINDTLLQELFDDCHEAISGEAE